jgi:hypothetical protein
VSRARTVLAPAGCEWWNRGLTVAWSCSIGGRLSPSCGRCPVGAPAGGAEDERAGHRRAATDDRRRGSLVGVGVLRRIWVCPGVSSRSIGACSASIIAKQSSTSQTAGEALERLHEPSPEVYCNNGVAAVVRCFGSILTQTCSSEGWSGAVSNRRPSAFSSTAVLSGYMTEPLLSRSAVESRWSLVSAVAVSAAVASYDNGRLASRLLFLESRG